MVGRVAAGRWPAIPTRQSSPRRTRVERYAGRCRCCGQVILTPVPEGLEPVPPFSVNVLALAIYLRFIHAISYQRLSRLFRHLFALQISEGALDAMFRRAKPPLLSMISDVFPMID